MTYPTREAMTALNRALRLPATGREQDWDIELADADRVGEFVEYLDTRRLTDDEKVALMALALGSLEDLAQREAVPPVLTDAFKRLLKADVALYADLIRSWSPRETDPDGFAISPMFESLRHATGKPDVVVGR